MIRDNHISAFGEILIFLVGGLIFVIGGLLTSWLVRPNRPNTQKLETYESGEQPLGSGWTRFNIRFYTIAILFLLFEVEIIFLFPWAIVFGDKQLIDETNGLWGWFSLVEMFIFIFILAFGLAYAWVKGHLDWPKSKLNKTDFDSPVPGRLYDKVNEKYKYK